MKRVLVVCPHFAPVNAPDGHRIRMLAPHFADLGWEATILTVTPKEVAAPLEPFLAESLPANLRVITVKALSLQWCRRWGVGNLGWRALPYLWREGVRLLQTEKFDLIYFSTTQFACLPLGRIWQSRFRVPYVIDLQDPWVNTYYDAPDAPAPPGGWKYRVAKRIALWLERWTLQKAAHVIAVSPGYLTALEHRYAWFSAAKNGSVIPFGWSQRDLDMATSSPAPPRHQKPFDRTISYVGRIGEDMRPLLRVLFAAFSHWLKKSPSRPRVGWVFEGTTYDERLQGAGIATDEAQQAGVAEFVKEHPRRIPLQDSYRSLLQADANLIMGSTDRTYSPSKIGPTIAANKPWLALVQSESVAATKLTEVAVSGGTVVCHDGTSGADTLGEWFTRIQTNTLVPSAFGKAFPAAFAQEESTVLAAHHARVFEKVTTS